MDWRVMHTRSAAIAVFILCLSPGSGPCALAVAQSHLESLISEIAAEVKPLEGMEYMRRVYATDRWFTFPKFHETAGYLKRTLEDIGLRNVEIIDAPADGLSQFGYWTMPLAWDVKQARLEITQPAVSEKFRVLADYQTTPTSLGMWSGPTPPHGVNAEVIELKESSPDAIEKLDLKGKLVLTNQNPASIKWLLAKKGALGAINAFTENPLLKDGRQWINAWGDNGWAFTKGNAPLLCFSIAPRQADFLRKLIAQHGKVYVKATVNSRYYSGTYPYVTGNIPGASSKEEVLMLGHTSEQGANDNASGVAAMLESLATLERLIVSGKLPRPARSIRILAMGELYGSMHYVATNPERVRQTVAAMCIDTPAGFYHLAGTEYTFYMNPHVAKSYVDALILNVASAYLSNLPSPRTWHWNKFATGTDTYLSDPMIGIPTVWPYGGTGVHTHHNSEDKPDTVDPRSLRDLSVIIAAFVYVVASAGEPQAYWHAEVAQTRGYEEILQTVSPILDRVFSLVSLEELERTLELGLALIAYDVDRENQAILSVLRLVDEGRRDQLLPTLAPILERARRFGEDQSNRLRETVNRRAREIKISAPINPGLQIPDPQLIEAEAMVVKRKRIGTIPLDEIPPYQREGYPSGAWAIVPITALYWCDGHRNLAEVIRLTQFELGPVKFDFVGYFRFLEKHGYVDLVRR